LSKGGGSRPKQARPSLEEIFKSGSPPASEEARLKQLEFQKICAEAGTQFWKEWKQADAGAARVPGVETVEAYTNHYSYELNKCLVEVNSTTFNTQKHFTSNSEEIYDAYEKAVIGSKTVISRRDEPDRTTLMKEGNSIEPQAANLRWFDDLMKK
jgi:hypothetical protein